MGHQFTTRMREEVVGSGIHNDDSRGLFIMVVSCGEEDKGL